MSVWYLTPASLGYLAQFILSLAIAVYLGFLGATLWQRKVAAFPTALLGGFFVCLAVFILLCFLNVSVHPDLRLYFLYGENPVIALGLLFLLQFAYHFPSRSPRQSWEARIVLGLSLAYALWESGYALWRLGLLAGQEVIYRPPVADWPLVIGAVWLFVVFLRQTVRVSTTRHNGWQALWRPQGQAALASRSFALIFASFLGLSLLELARTYHFIPSEMREISFSLVILLTLFAFGVAYLNALPETTTFMTKLVGMALVTILAMVGMAGWLIFPASLNAFAIDGLLARNQTLRFTPNSHGGYDIRAAPFSFETDLGARLNLANEDYQELSLAFAFPFYGQSWRKVYVLDDGTVSLGQVLDWKDALYHYGPTPAIFALFVDLNPESPAPSGVYARNESDRLTLTWYRLPQARRQNPLTFQLSLYPGGIFDITFEDVGMAASDIYDSANMSGIIGAVPGGERPAQAVNLAAIAPSEGISSGGQGVVDNLYLRLRQHLHQFLLPLAKLILASSLVVLAGFPLFFRRTLVRPLDALLDGMRQVNTGNLHVAMPVRYRDEIGFLTESFNNMVAQLRVLVTQLELRVAERTQRLEQQTLELAQAKAWAEERSQAAEAANRAKSLFLAHMSHELRTPLSAILGFSELMARDPRLDAAQQEHLAVINRSGEHLLRLINDVLDMAKIESGRMTLQEQDFDLDHLLDSLVGMWRFRATQKGLALRVDRAPHVPRYLQADQGKLRQVLINLLSNAIKFTEQGSVVLRVTGQAYGGDSSAQDTPPAAGSRFSLHFEVEDTGVGVAPEEVDTIFDAFVQGSRGQPCGQGSGLGLALSREYVRLMGGELRVQSRVGAGSTFYFDIPVEAVPAAGTLHGHPTRRVVGLAPGQPRYRLLVAEDSPENRALLISLLRAWSAAPDVGSGFEVRQASNGQEALEIWEEWQPHLVWMDMRMPVLDGCAATRRIKATPQGQNTIVVALTASAFEEDREQILAAGCDDLIHKPFHAGQLMEVLARHLGLRFVVEELPGSCAAPATAPGLQAPDLAGMPAEWLAALRQAALEADIARVHALLEAVRGCDGRLAEPLAAWAAHFEYDKILECIQNAERHPL